MASSSGLSFTSAAQAGADWTADQMAGGTYIFIYLPSGLCLAFSRVSVAALERCNLGAGQRWIRQRPVTGTGGLEYWQLRNLSTGRCLTAVAVAGTARAAQAAARLERCQASPSSPQLIAFLAAS